MPGVVSVLSGYAGGTLEDPTYQRMGDHTEVIEIRFDPAVISYGELLELFFQWHEPHPVMQRQYRSVVLAADEEQFAAAQEAVELRQQQLGRSLATAVEMLDRFYEAEAYHQKFYLQNWRPGVVNQLNEFYGAGQWYGTQLAGLLNGIAAREATAAEVLEQLDRYALSETEQSLARSILLQW